MTARKLRIQYEQDEKALIVRVRLNKATRWLSETDRLNIDSLGAHFTALGYSVIVED